VDKALSAASTASSSAGRRDTLDEQGKVRDLTMKANRPLNVGDFVKRERQRWHDEHLLAPNALQDFPKLTAKAFRHLRRRYFSPADLVAEMSPIRRRLDINDIAPASSYGQLPSPPSQVRRAPIRVLSPAKRAALIECFSNGGLDKQEGRWRGSQHCEPISGVTVADLSRDGMLVVTRNRQNASAQLTERGRWFAQTLLQAAPALRCELSPAATSSLPKSVT
jgi:hypothetical protein